MKPIARWLRKIFWENFVVSNLRFLSSMRLVMTLTLKMCVQCVYNGTSCNGHCVVILQSFVCQLVNIRKVNPVETKKEWYSGIWIICSGISSGYKDQCAILRWFNQFDSQTSFGWFFLRKNKPQSRPSAHVPPLLLSPHTWSWSTLMQKKSKRLLAVLIFRGVVI